MYSKLVSNIDKKILSAKVPFLNELMNRSTAVHLTFIIKSISYSHFVLNSLILYTETYMKLENTANKMQQYEIKLGEEELSEWTGNYLSKADPKKFIVQIFLEIINRKMVNLYKYIVEFCLTVIQQSKLKNAENYSMVMLLVTRLLIEQGITNVCIQAILGKLLKEIK